MALVIEDGSIVENANSYVSIDDCDEYHATLGNASWTGADAVKEQAIIRAMKWLERRQWKGRKYDYEQPLQWPRVDVYAGGYEVYYDIVPQDVIDALCEAALVELLEPSALRPSLDRGGMVTSFTLVGVMSETYSGNAPGSKTYETIMGPLRDYVRSGGNIKVELA